VEDSVFAGVRPGLNPAAHKLYDVISPKAGVHLDCTSCESRILGLLTHFVYDEEAPRGRSRFCAWEEGGCRYCLDRKKQVYQGYLGVFCHTLGKRIVLCLGEESAVDLAQYSKKYAGLHLMKFACRKPDTGTRSKLDFRPSSHVGVQVDPAGFDILPSVARVLGVACLPEYRYTARELSEEVPNG